MTSSQVVETQVTDTMTIGTLRSNDATATRTPLKKVYFLRGHIQVQKGKLTTPENTITYHNVLVCHPKLLHKHCFHFLLGVKMAPRESENNAYANFWSDKQRALWYVMVFSGVVNTISSLLVYVLHKMSRHFHVVVVQKRERNVQKKCDARAKLLFCL